MLLIEYVKKNFPVSKIETFSENLLNNNVKNCAYETKKKSKERVLLNNVLKVRSAINTLFE